MARIQPPLALLDDRRQDAAVVAKVMGRLIPFMCFLYFLNYIDRVNIQFAKLEMNQALHLNDAQYGLAAGIWGTLGPFWSLPHLFLRGTAAAAGVALINSIGNLMGGFIGPTVVGQLKEVSKSFHSGLVLTSIVLLAALLLTPFLHAHQTHGTSR